MPSTTTQSPLKIALVHDYLREFGGAERVLIALHELFPEAPVYTAFVDQEALGIHWQKFADWDLRTTWLASIPGIKKIYSPLRVLAPSAFGALDLSAFDVVISSSNAYEAKAVVVPSGKHLCYCHTPPRSLYGYSTMTDWKKNWFLKVGGSLINHYMRMIDFSVAQKVGLFIANSAETKRRIQKFYRRDSVVVFPPVNMPLPDQISLNNESHNESKKAEYYLYVNRLAFAKHPEIAVAACTKLSVPLKVVGAGPLLAELKALAGPTITFEGAVDDAQLSKLYAGAKALLYPVEDEDFGMVPIEAMGHGVPVIAHRSGGPLETILEGKTGFFFDVLTVAGLTQVMQLFESAQLNGSKSSLWDRRKISQHAQQFSTLAFREKIRELVQA